METVVGIKELMLFFFFFLIASFSTLDSEQKEKIPA